MNTVLKIMKFIFIIAILLFIVIFFTFFIYIKRLDYQIPKNVHIEVYDANEELYLNLNNETRRNYVKIENIDSDIIDAFLSIEDKDFYNHKGINIKRIFGALLNNIKKKEIIEGASTITQQYVKNIFLNSEKKLKRKIDEAIIAINLETKHSKNEILEGYLNSIYFDHGLYGIEDACRFYFNKSASNITIKEAAILASIPKSPINYSPIKNLENNTKRTNLILNQLYLDEKISLEEKDNALLETVEFYGKLDSASLNNAPYFQDIIINQLSKINIDNNIKENGIKVYTTLDLNLNSIIKNAIDKYYPLNSNLELAIVAINSKNGEVLSVIGGKDYQASVYNRAIYSLRQPGSTIKPFLYYTALNNGFTVTTTFNSTKTEFVIDNDTYSPKNYNDIYPDREVTMAYALATSDNIYAVKTHLFMGVNKLKDTLIDFGFTNKINANPSLALGTSEVTLLELTTGYARLASLGKELTASYISKITDLSGDVLYLNKQNIKQKHSYNDCYLLTEALTNTFDNNLAININVTLANISSRMKSKFAAKSGSTDYDNWIVGYNPDITLGIWTGYDDSSVVKNTQTKYIKNIWAEIISNYNSTSWYNTPIDIISIKLNPTTGMMAKSNEYEKDLYFNKNNLPFYIYLKRMETIFW